MQDLIANLESAVKSYGPAVLAAAIILVVGLLGARLVRTALRRGMRRARVDEALVGFLSGLVYALLIAFVLIAVLSKLGVNTTSFAAVLAAAGLAIGLALQGSLSNFAAGVMLIARRPFSLGDFIEAAGTSGTVMAITIFTTELKTADNKKVIVPNSEILSDVITNYSAHDTRRIDLVIGIGYDDDIRRAKEVLNSVIAADERVLAEPEPQVAVSELADSSVNLVVRPWVATRDYWAVRFALTERIKQELDAAGISIPYPQRDLHLHQAPEE